MALNKLRIALHVLLIACATSAFASEKKEEAPAAEGGGEGGAPVEPTSKEQRQYSEKSAKLKTLATRITDSEKEFQALIEEKEHLKNKPEETQAILARMVEVASTRNKTVEEYNKLKSDIELRYPSEGAAVKRQYQTQNKKTVEEMEGVAGLDELLTRTKKVVEKKFNVFAEEESVRLEEEKKLKKPKSARRPTVPTPSPTAVEETPEEKPERLRLEK
jgi:hypothetical protein